MDRSAFWHAGTECAGVALQPIQQLWYAVFGVKHFLYVQCRGMHAISICMMACPQCCADSRGCDVKKGCLLASGVLCKSYSVLSNQEFGTKNIQLYITVLLVACSAVDG